MAKQDFSSQNKDSNLYDALSQSGNPVNANHSLRAGFDYIFLRLPIPPPDYCLFYRKDTKFLLGFLYFLVPFSVE